MQVNNNTDSSRSQPVSAKFANGWLDGLDGRLGLARELRQRLETLTNDLGGSDSLSYAESSLCERALLCCFYGLELDPEEQRIFEYAFMGLVK